MNYCLKQFEKIKDEIGNKKLNTIYLHDEKIIFKRYFKKIYYNLIDLRKKNILINLVFQSMISKLLIFF